MWWRELCPMVVVLARAPLTRWLRRWNMLIKPKTTSKNLHQIVTLVVSGATVRFIYGETCTCRHACSSVRVRWYLRAVCVVPESVSCGQRHDAGVLWVIIWQELSYPQRVCDSLWINFSFDINHLCMHCSSYSIFPGRKWRNKQPILYVLKVLIEHWTNSLCYWLLNVLVEIQTC